MKRKSNTVADKLLLEQDGASLEAAGFISPSAPSTSSTTATNTGGTAGSTTSSSAPLADVLSTSSSHSGANAATGITAAAASTAAENSSSRIELVARVVGEAPTRNHQSSSKLKKEERGSTVATNGAGGAGGGNGGGAAAGGGTGSTAGKTEGIIGSTRGSAATPSSAGSDGGSGGADGPQGAQPHDLIGVNDLLDGWAEDDRPCRWPSLAMSSERLGVVTVLFKGRLDWKKQQLMASSPTPEDTAAMAGGSPAGEGFVDESSGARWVGSGVGLDAGGGANGGTGDSGQGHVAESVVEVGGTVPKRLSFRRPSASGMGVTKMVARSQSSSSFNLATRISRWTPRVSHPEEQGGASEDIDIASSVPGMVTAEDIARDEGAAASAAPNGAASTRDRSRSPPARSAIGKLDDVFASRVRGGRESAAAASLHLLLPDERGMRAPPPLPLPPPLPHKPEMLLLADSSAYFSNGEGLSGSGGGGTGGGGGGGGGSGNSGSSSSALTSLPSFSSLLSSAQSGRGIAAAAAAAAAGVAGSNSDSASGAAAGGNAPGDAPKTAAETVGEQQHMEQLFDMLELDLGMSKGKSRQYGGALGHGSDSDSRVCRGRAEANLDGGSGEAAPCRQDNQGLKRGRVNVDGGTSKEDVGDGLDGQGNDRDPSGRVLRGNGIETTVDYNASLWHILQVNFIRRNYCVYDN